MEEQSILRRLEATLFTLRKWSIFHLNYFAFFKFSVHNSSEQSLSSWQTLGLCQAHVPQSWIVFFHRVTIHLALIRCHISYSQELVNTSLNYFVFFKFSVHNLSEQSLSLWQTSGLCQAWVQQSQRVFLHGGTIHFTSMRSHIIYLTEMVNIN